MTEDEKTILPGSITDLAESTDKRERARTILMGRHRLASMKLEGALRKRIEELEKALAESRARAHAEGKAEGRREMALEAAAVCDVAAAANIGGESMDEWPWPAKMWGALTSQAEKLSDRIRSLIPAAPLPAGEVKDE